MRKGKTMKTSRYSRVLGILLLVGCLVFAVSKIAPATGRTLKPPSIKDLPPIVLETCVGVQQVMTRNPFSFLPNDYLLLTKYEGNPGRTNPVRKGVNPGKALDMYLLQGVLVSPNREIGLVHDSVLIVKVSTISKQTSRKTVREWILIDENGDRSIDKGIYRETVTGKGKSPIASIRVVISRNLLRTFQAYFEKATATLDARAAEGPAGDCVTL